ncbi:hypothetical protein ACSZME_09850 [Aeromonas dhakensis]|uniref:hypothetical protein n=1 Tax=Aeromonas dhakensis TaxID=196024 RepID=UPI0039872520
MTSHTLSLSLCLFCCFNFNHQTIQLLEGLPSGCKKGLRHGGGKPSEAKPGQGWQNVAQVLPKLGEEGKRSNIPVTGIL